MIVYGDRATAVPTRAVVATIEDGLAALEAWGPGLPRHSALAALLLQSGELAQGLGDRVFDEAGCDRRDASADAAMVLAVVLARQLWRSHLSGYREVDPPTAIWRALARVARGALPETVNLRSPEGFRHYAVYPEAYGAAAATLAPGVSPLVIGVRTIGATLSAMVAAVCGAEAPPLTVRPVGPPLERQLQLCPDLRRTLAGARGRGLAVVDEGPGLSGSSFGAVLDAADAAGIPEPLTQVFPSNLGLGACASERARARWARLAPRCVPFEAMFLECGPTGLAGWVEDLIGPLDRVPEDIGAGRWRGHVFREARHWPGVCAPRERRKYLLGAGGRRFVARFVGLGRAGEAAHLRARALAEAGFAAPVLGLRHGFLVQRWVEDARPLPEAGAVSGAEIAAWLADYLAFRARATAAGPERGGGPRALFEMASVNLREAFGDEGTRRLALFAPMLDDLERAARPVEVDGRLHRWEWLVLQGGRLLKADAVDHCDGHDPIGCQDIAWDLAGAENELDLGDQEVAHLRGRLRAFSGVLQSDGDNQRAHVRGRDALAFYRLCYLAFQIGFYEFGARSTDDPEEVERLRGEVSRYRRRFIAVAR